MHKLESEWVLLWQSMARRCPWPRSVLAIPACSRPAPTCIFPVQMWVSLVGDEEPVGDGVGTGLEGRCPRNSQELKQKGA